MRLYRQGTLDCDRVYVQGVYVWVSCEAEGD